jgi:hypothetical protein
MGAASGVLTLVVAAGGDRSVAYRAGEMVGMLLCPLLLVAVVVVGGLVLLTKSQRPSGLPPPPLPPPPHAGPRGPGPSYAPPYTSAVAPRPAPDPIPAPPVGSPMPIAADWYQADDGLWYPPNRGAVPPIT